MASMTSWFISCHVLLNVAHFGICKSDLIRDGVWPELNIFHHSCALKKDEGPCKALKDRFYFDIDTGRCEPFEYGGCQGNANNFETLEECEEMCVVKADKSPCHLEDEPGPCRGLVPRYFFDSKIQDCKRFFYGGCFGNANNFKTVKECHTKCQPGNKTVDPEVVMKIVEPTKPSRQPLISADKVVNATHTQPQAAQDFTPPEFCLSPIDKGHCGGSEKRHVYNPKTKRCQLFRYSGCGGNKNNFVLKRHCMKMCMKDHSKRRVIRIKKKNSYIILPSV